jgi:molecular chaperone GrpE
MTKHHDEPSKGNAAPEQVKQPGANKPGETEALAHLSCEELEAKLNEAEAKANESWDKLLRMQAEMENVRRRAERDVAGAHKYGQEKIIAEMLLVVDSLERSLSGVSPDLQATAKALVDGLNMTMNMLLKALERFGVKQINPKGEQFNPQYHEALTAQPHPELAPNTVIDVMQKGYLLHDRLLRPALVIVSKA